MNKARGLTPHIVKGREYMTVYQTAKRWGCSDSFVKERLRDGFIPYIKQAIGNRKQAINLIPIDAVKPQPKYKPRMTSGRFQAVKPLTMVKCENPDQVKKIAPDFKLHCDGEGVPCPADIDYQKPEVNCSECPHWTEKSRKCYALAKHLNAEGELKYCSCHRIGRVVIPPEAWLNPGSFMPDLKINEGEIARAAAAHAERPEVRERMKEVADKVMQMVKAATDKAEARAAAPTTIPNPDDAFRAAMLKLDIEAEALKQEAEELEDRFEYVTDRISKISRAADALRALGL